MYRILKAAKDVPSLKAAKRSVSTRAVRTYSGKQNRLEYHIKAFSYYFAPRRRRTRGITSRVSHDARRKGYLKPSQGEEGGPEKATVLEEFASSNEQRDKNLYSEKPFHHICARHLPIFLFATFGSKYCDILICRGK